MVKLSQRMLRMDVGTVNPDDFQGVLACYPEHSGYIEEAGVIFQCTVGGVRIPFEEYRRLARQYMCDEEYQRSVAIYDEYEVKHG